MNKKIIPTGLASADKSTLTDITWMAYNELTQRLETVLNSINEHVANLPESLKKTDLTVLSFLSENLKPTETTVKLKALSQAYSELAEVDTALHNYNSRLIANINENKYDLEKLVNSMTTSSLAALFGSIQSSEDLDNLLSKLSKGLQKKIFADERMAETIAVIVTRLANYQAPADTLSALDRLIISHEEEAVITNIGKAINKYGTSQLICGLYSRPLKEHIARIAPQVTSHWFDVVTRH